VKSVDNEGLNVALICLNIGPLGDLSLLFDFRFLLLPISQFRISLMSNFESNLRHNLNYDVHAVLSEEGSFVS